MKAVAILLIAMIMPEFVLAGQTKRKQVRQRTRLQNGVKSGELTRKEAVNLRAGKRKIRRGKKDALSDGVVTAEEWQDIRKDQRKQSRKIYRKKHNNRERFEGKNGYIREDTQNTNGN